MPVTVMQNACVAAAAAVTARQRSEDALQNQVLKLADLSLVFNN